MKIRTLVFTALLPKQPHSLIRVLSCLILCLSPSLSLPFPILASFSSPYAWDEARLASWTCSSRLSMLLSRSVSSVAASMSWPLALLARFRLPATEAPRSDARSSSASSPSSSARMRFRLWMVSLAAGELLIRLCRRLLVGEYASKLVPPGDGV